MRLEAVSAVLDRRLLSSSQAPLAVGLSGGGDSLALLLIADQWARAHGRRLLVLTVDHGLNPLSAEWTARCGRIAGELGWDFRALAWTGDKPTTGLPAAARRARHALLADAARKEGAKVILLGHTADDLAEGAAMRDEGSSVSDPREWSPSPAWPQGRGVFLLRPMLGLRRAQIRDWLRAQGRDWIDDPANEDRRFARSRARAASPSLVQAAEVAAEEAVAEPLAARWGLLNLPRTLSARSLAAACLSAAGTDVPPRGERLERVMALVRGGEPFTATLAGARIEGLDDRVLIARNAGEAARGGLAESPLAPGVEIVWDGRFEITASQPGLSVAALRGHASRLPKSERDALKAVPALARPSLPVILHADKSVTCPLLDGETPVRVRALAAERHSAACGLTTREPG
ncbi:tRNA lysidine(34) synthetase TilS [Caulobacter segnis]|uniref:tRNA lysidine(34) synthetase TilS n=1 Tax=Caulobacter segnis TaxID=88688 RepID=UPI00240F480F|nr:tRNA lysidine(34) synthetase TilS [Caulobacter segnis]MDG2520912.1 tRNA lysidine(34) synthetase TilS [Caulobacter segnis]